MPGLGHMSEIFDGDAPHRPCGCVAQAWSVGEVLRALVEDVPGLRPAIQTDNRVAQAKEQPSVQPASQTQLPRTATGI